MIGAASSGHDVCVDLWESGAEVTMVQRSPTTVVRSDTLMELAFEIYSESALERGLTTDAADMLVASTPFALLAESQKALYDGIANATGISTKDSGMPASPSISATTRPA